MICWGKKSLIALFALTATFVGAQSAIPRPFVYGGLDLGNNVGYVGGVGLQENTMHFLFAGDASYDNDGKSDDNANVLRNGFDRRFKGAAYARLTNGWFFGAGARWALLHSAAYDKEQWHPTAGIGKDIIDDDFSMRFVADYVTPFGAEHTSRNGCTVPKGQCGNGVQGIDVSLFFPSPQVRGHFFARITIGAYGAHATVTSTDPKLTSQQKSSLSALSETQLTLMYRF